ncbi:hypothetical protein [Mycobacterium sp. 236(2023)]|uniref:hypothetical protein n=1 Tax=Mycobacterium sp. 236(2023) TaxID=3038163 RepID=UPI002415939A|nr:hypothetical protein [Mycobacterium sp. 236(2023)]MDG4663054.1 hypothetical protein [Mycobacterium sp. 236(2023)]
MAINIIVVVRRILAYDMTLAEWLGTALILGAPYGVMGVVFSVFKPDHIVHADGILKVAAFVGTVVFWPVLLFADVCP